MIYTKRFYALNKIHSMLQIIHRNQTCQLQSVEQLQRYESSTLSYLLFDLSALSLEQMVHSYVHLLKLGHSISYFCTCDSRVYLIVLPEDDAFTSRPRIPRVLLDYYLS